jgi:hypothetical protein
MAIRPGERPAYGRAARDAGDCFLLLTFLCRSKEK